MKKDSGKVHIYLLGLRMLLVVQRKSNFHCDAKIAQLHLPMLLVSGRPKEKCFLTKEGRALLKEPWAAVLTLDTAE